MNIACVFTCIYNVFVSRKDLKHVRQPSLVVLTLPVLKCVARWESGDFPMTL